MKTDDLHSNTTATSDDTSIYQPFSSPLAYSICSISYVAVLYAVSNSLNKLGPFSTFLASLIIAVPMVTISAYWSAVMRVVFWQGALQERSWIVRLLSGYWWRVVLAVILSIWASIYLIVRVIFSPGSEWSLWASVLVSIPLLYFSLHCASKPLLTKGVRPFARCALFSVPASVTTALAATLVFGIAENWGADHPRYDDLFSAIEAQASYSGSSAPVEQLFNIMRTISALSDFGLTALRTNDGVGRLAFPVVYILSVFVFFVSITVALSPFLFRLNELINRTIAPSSMDLPTVPKPWKRSVVIFTIVLLCCVYAFLFFDIHRDAELIENRLVRPGTISMIHELQEQTTSKIGDISADSYRGLIEPDLRMAFDRMRKNVPRFLDWYYSMSAELIRFVAAVEGSHEQEMRERMFEFVMEGDPFARVEAELAVLNHVRDTMITRFREERDGLIEERAIDVEDGTPLETSKEVSASELASAFAAESIPFETRLWGSVGGAALGSAVGQVIGSRVVARLAAKGLIKRASAALLAAVPRTLARRITARLAGAAAGARAGSTAGAAGGVWGRAIGAAVGAVAGAVAVDAALLKLEELLGRDKLRESIVHAIDELEDETITQMREVFLSP